MFTEVPQSQFTPMTERFIIREVAALLCQTNESLEIWFLLDLVIEASLCEKRLHSSSLTVFIKRTPVEVNAYLVKLI